MRLYFVLFAIFCAAEEDLGRKKKERGKTEDTSPPKPTTDPDRDPLVDRFEKIERKVVAWNDRFGMDPSRKDRITRKISNTMKQLIEKSRKAAASDCRKVKSKNQVNGILPLKTILTRNIYSQKSSSETKQLPKFKRSKVHIKTLLTNT